MDVRAQVAMVFHLDKCIGCHTCSVSCKNVWTDRPGAEYMWWNNVETKPGTGYPTAWEDQEQYRGGWTLEQRDQLSLKSQNKLSAYLQLFYNPNQPGLDDYYEPWTYRYEDLFTAPEGELQPTARPISLVTGEPLEIEAGPNWDDDLSGSPVYAAHDPNLAALRDEERAQLFSLERLVITYLPRICNHCANPACVAACPSGALHKRGEDGVVLIDQDLCRGWRNCVSACPYKKTYFNWRSGKSEKCVLCFPRIETGQAPACFHSCVGRIRYLGVLLYDADQLPAALTVPDAALVATQRAALLDPDDPQVQRSALAAGMSQALLEAARRSPVRRWVLDWKLALPLHPEFRTFPMLYYVPPLLPVPGTVEDGLYDHLAGDPLAGVSRTRLPLRYLARLFAAGNEDEVEAALRKLLAVRLHRRAEEVGDVTAERVARALRDAELTPAQADAIYRLTALAPLQERYVYPPMERESTVGCGGLDARGSQGGGGLGGSRPAVRGSR